MDVMELGAIGELIGGTAVIASLIFVGMQVRQSNRQSEDAAAREVATQFDRVLETIQTDAKAREVWWAFGRGASWFDPACTEFVDGEARLPRQAGGARLIYSRS